jgi:hypothetical protein
VSSTSILKLRPSRAALIAVLFLAICVTPMAGVQVWLFTLYLLPIGVILWILRAGTDIGDDGVTVRAVLGHRTFGWASVRGFAIAARGELRLVLRDGRLVRMPCARLRHLELITAASGGRMDAVAAESSPPAAD